MPKAFIYVVAAILAVALVASGVFIWQLETDIAKLRDHPAATQTASLESQKLCAEQAHKFYHDGGYDQRSTDGSISGYVDHYSLGRNHCFMVLSAMTPQKDSILQSYSLWDAFEGVDYAEYLESSVLPGGVSEVVMCSVTIPDRPRVLCHSKKEWGRLVRGYSGISPF